MLSRRSSALKMSVSFAINEKLRATPWQGKPSLLHGELTRALPLDAALPHTAGEQHPHLARRSHQLTLPPSCRLHPRLASGCLPWPIKGGRLPPVALSPHTHHRALILILPLRTPGASSPMLSRAHNDEEETVFLRRGGRTIYPC